MGEGGSIHIYSSLQFFFNFTACRGKKMVGALWRAVLGRAVLGRAGRGGLMNGNSALTRTALMYGYANWEHPHKICTGIQNT